VEPRGTLLSIGARRSVGKRGRQQVVETHPEREMREEEIQGGGKKIGSTDLSLRQGVTSVRSFMAEKAGKTGEGRRVVGTAFRWRNKKE